MEPRPPANVERFEPKVDRFGEKLDQVRETVSLGFGLQSSRFGSLKTEPGKKRKKMVPRHPEPYLLLGPSFEFSFYYVLSYTKKMAYMF